MQSGQKLITLTIPNEEVRYIFRNKVLAWFRDEIRKRDLLRLFHAFAAWDYQTASRQKTAYVVEFKVAERFQALVKKADEALKQIEDKVCGRELRDDGYDVVVYYEIAFFGKNCEVRVRE